MKKLLTPSFREFGNSPLVKLKIQSPSENEHSKRLALKLQSLKFKNVEFNNKVLPWKQYIEFMKSLDCYTLVLRVRAFL